MELVLLGDTQGGYGSCWIRVANTDGIKDVKIGDCFREQGFGPGAEQLEVAGVDISPIGGASRLFFNRAANATQPEVHRLGAVLLPVGNSRHLNTTVVSGTIESEYRPTTGMPELDAAIEQVAVGVVGRPQSEDVPLKRGRGRPKGSKNVRKEEVAFPTGF